jgi:hypothetical protein
VVSAIVTAAPLTSLSAKEPALLLQRFSFQQASAKYRIVSSVHTTTHKIIKMFEISLLELNYEWKKYK